MLTLSASAYYGLTHAHVGFAVLFLLIYLIRWVLLLLNRDEQHARFKAVSKWPDRIISVGFLVSGIVLALSTGNLAGTWFFIKVGAILVSIPLAVIGFKRKQKVLATLSIVLLVYSYGISETKAPNMEKSAYYDAVATKWNGPDEAKLATYNEQSESYDILDHGQQIYLRYCINCHGPNGDMQRSGSAILGQSQLELRGIYEYLKQKHKAMPSYAKILTEPQRMAVSSYVYAKLGNGRIAPHSAIPQN